MGLNTSMIVLNDALHGIAEDKDFGAKVADAVMLAGRHHRFRPEHGIDISTGCHANGATVVETHHADYTALLAFGGNCVSNLGSVFGYRHNEEEVRVKLLKMLAAELGYEVTPKRKK